jgi:hypothetical protein
MMFTAHVPHPHNYPTWFGYLKDDGYTIHKKKGHIPINWETKKARFLSVYPFYESPGLSVRFQVGPEDEWCAEAYLETDFTVLTRANFEKKLRTYLGHQFVVGNMSNISAEAVSSDKLDLGIGEWQSFRFDDLFNIRKGYYNKKPPETQSAEKPIPFIGATEFNNGVTSLHDIDDIVLYSRNGEENPYEPKNRKIFPPNGITVSNNGSVGNAFYQPAAFTCSHDVNPLYLTERPMSAEVGLFLSTVIEVDRYRWGYGRKWRPARMPNSTMKLPVRPDGSPDWIFMERFIRSLSHSSNLPKPVSDSPEAFTNPEQPNEPLTEASGV